MSIKKKLVGVVSTVSIVMVAAGPDYHRTRPGVRCEIPNREYQYKKYSQPLRSLSNVPVLIEVPLSENILDGRSLVGTIPRSSEPKQLTVKSFQFVKDPTLIIDHCSISQMSVLLDETGRWTVSLLANQNPLNTQQPLDVTTIEPNQLFTDHLKRNQFHVVARCYVQFGPADTNRLIGKPLVIPLYVKPFWVQKQKPYQLFETDGYSPEIRRYFGSIDRVEIEFAYQRD